MADFEGVIKAPVLSVIAQEVLALIKNDAALRKVWGLNAPRACYFASGTLVTPTAQVINEANSGNGEVFFQLVVIYDPSAGAINFRIDGPPAAAAVPAGGLAFPAGGGTLVITGNDNIRNFSHVAQGATTAPFTRVLFK